MRDVGKVKDRFELKLDTQRVFFLFAGLTAYSALVFVLGVVVGRSARPGVATVAAAPVRLPDERPTPQRIEERLGEAKPKATEEPEIPLKAIWELDKPGSDRSLTASITPAPEKATPAPKPTEKPAATPAATAVAGDANGAWTLQVVSYAERAQAQTMESSLRTRGFDAYTVTAQVPGKGTFHRVRVGRYASREVAEKAAIQLAAAQPGITPLVMSFE